MPKQTRDQLHAAIMNLRGNIMPTVYAADPAKRQAYELGYRDARHAAAELVLQAELTDESAPPGAMALPVEGEGQPDSVYSASPVQSEGALSGEAQELIERDATRFQWYFSDKPKGDWLATYLDGVRTGWTIDQWRAAIDAALKEQPQ